MTAIVDVRWWRYTLIGILVQWDTFWQWVAAVAAVAS